MFMPSPASLGSMISPASTTVEPDMGPGAPKRGHSNRSHSAWTTSGRPSPSRTEGRSAGFLLKSPMSRTSSHAPVRLSMDDATTYYQAKKNPGSTVSRRIEEAVALILKNFKGRDFVFFIDDTETMQAHARHVITVFRALGYIAKDCDKDGIELRFVSAPDKKFRHSDTTRLVRILESHKYQAIEGRIESSITDLVNKIIIPKLPLSLHGIHFDFWAKPVTIFIFTDAKWGENVPVGNGVEKPIRNLMEKIKKRKLSRTQVMIQFLRFGDDENGKEHLDFLDDFGGRPEEDWQVKSEAKPSHDFRDLTLSPSDVVDTRHVTEDVYSMFVGSYTKGMDASRGESARAKDRPPLS